MRAVVMADESQSVMILLAKVAQGLEELGERFDSFRDDVGERFDSMERQFDELRGEVASSLAYLDQRLDGFHEELSRFDWRLTNLEQRFDDSDNNGQN